MATIVDQLAQNIGTSAANLLKGQYSASDLDRIRNSIKQTIANALSPPSNGPPGSAAQEADALATRLQNLVEAIARDAKNGTGQQNEIAGNILDANSAKELPAHQQGTNGTASTLDVSSVVRSLLASVVAALNTPATNVAPAVSPSPSSVQSSAAASTPVQLATQQITSPVTTDAPSTVTTGLLNQATANAVSSQQNITMSNAPDLLARMLVRAAGADAQMNGGAAAAGADSSAATGATAPVPSGTLTPTMLAAKFAAILSDVDPSAVTASSSPTNTSTNTNSGHTFGQDFAQQTPSGANAASLIAPPSANLGSQAQNALQSSGSGSSVDPNKILEQMLSGMTMRTLAQGTSEIRLQLQPENLGQVTMRLTVSGNQVSASVIAQSADVRNTLVAGHQDLARSLSEAGLTLSGFSVDVSGGDAGQDQSKDRAAGFGRRYVVHELNGAATTDASETSNLGPSLLSGSGLELFNSLA